MYSRRGAIPREGGPQRSGKTVPTGVNEGGKKQTPARNPTMAYRPRRTKLLPQHTYSVSPWQSFELRRVDTQDHKPNSTYTASVPSGPVRPSRTLFLGGNGCRSRSCCRGRLGILGVEVINRLQNRLRLLVHVGEQGFDMVERWEREEGGGISGV